MTYARSATEDRDSGDWNQNSKTASKILPSITLEFVTTLVIVRYILDFARPATVKLQRKEMYLLKAHSEITTLKNALLGLRSNIDVEHHQLYEESVELAARIGLQPSKPRVIPVQVYRNNNPSQSIEGHYRVNLSTIFNDHALKQLDSRLPTEGNIFYQRFSIVPTIILANPSPWGNSVKQFCQHYSSDLPNIVGLPAELTLCEGR